MDSEGTNSYIKSIVESLLFISEKPVMLEQIREVLESIPAAEIKVALAELMKEYEDQRRGMGIMEIAGGYQMLSSPHYASYIRRFFKTRVKEKLSRPALEALAIVAYKQPVSRGDIELIRGVNSDGVMAHLLDKALIKIVGRKDIPGRPYIYGTTKLFLEYFGLKSLEDLPKLDDFPGLLSQEAAASVNVISAEDRSEIEQTFTQEAVDHEERKATAAAQAHTQESLAGQETFQRGEGMVTEELPPDAQIPGENLSADVPLQTPALEVCFAKEDGATAVEEPAELKEAIEHINKSENLSDIKGGTESPSPAE